MFYIFRPLRFEVWISLIGTGFVAIFAILATSAAHKGCRLPVNTALDDIWCSVRMVLAQSEILCYRNCRFERFFSES